MVANILFFSFFVFAFVFVKLPQLFIYRVSKAQTPVLSMGDSIPTPYHHTVQGNLSHFLCGTLSCQLSIAVRFYLSKL